MNICKVVSVVCGVLIFCGGYFNWGLIMNNYKARRLIKLLGEKGAKIFYMVLGVFFVVGGLIVF